MLVCILPSDCPCSDDVMLQTESDQEIQHLRDVIEDSGRKTQQLNDQVEELESKLNPSKYLVDGTSSNSVKQYLSSEKVIYLIGGFNGTSWLSALDSFSPSKDTLTPLKQMGCARSYAAAAALNDNIFVFGGGDGNSWFHTGTKQLHVPYQLFVYMLLVEVNLMRA